MYLENKNMRRVGTCYISDVVTINASDNLLAWWQKGKLYGLSNSKIWRNKTNKLTLVLAIYLFASLFLEVQVWIEIEEMEVVLVKKQEVLEDSKSNSYRKKKIEWRSPIAHHVLAD